jgi:hypothetical protein
LLDTVFLSLGDGVARPFPQEEAHSYSHKDLRVFVHICDRFVTPLSERALAQGMTCFLQVYERTSAPAGGDPGSYPGRRFGVQFALFPCGQYGRHETPSGGRSQAKARGEETTRSADERPQKAPDCVAVFSPVFSRDADDKRAAGSPSSTARKTRKPSSPVYSGPLI